MQHADLIIAAGGDGTFLGAAQSVESGHQVLVGVNSDRIGCVLQYSAFNPFLTVNECSNRIEILVQKCELGRIAQ